MCEMNKSCEGSACNGCPECSVDEKVCRTCLDWFGGVCHTPALDATGPDQSCVRWLGKDPLAAQDDPLLKVIEGENKRIGRFDVDGYVPIMDVYESIDRIEAAVVKHFAIFKAQTCLNDDCIYTEGICGDGAAILRDGVMLTITEVLRTLNRNKQSMPDATGDGGEFERARIRSLEAQLSAYRNASVSKSLRIQKMREQFEADALDRRRQIEALRTDMASADARHRKEIDDLLLSILAGSNRIAGLEADKRELFSALNSLSLSIQAHPDYTGEEGDEWTDLTNIAERLLAKRSATENSSEEVPMPDIKQLFDRERWNDAGLRDMYCIKHNAALDRIEAAVEASICRNCRHKDVHSLCLNVSSYAYGRYVSDVEGGCIHFEPKDGDRIIANNQAPSKVYSDEFTTLRQRITELEADKAELVNCLRDIQNSIDVYRDANGIRRGRLSFSWHLIDVIQILIDRHADNTDTHKNNKKDGE